MQLSWKEKKTKLYFLINAISDCYGADNPEWLREYCKEIISNYKNNLEEVLECFENAAQLTKCNDLVEISNKSLLNTNICPLCKYVPPFCTHN